MFNFNLDKKSMMPFRTCNSLSNFYEDRSIKSNNSLKGFEGFQKNC